MINIETLEWSYAFSYGPNNKINFSENPLLQLVGKNGHGKTSIASILEEGIYNKNSKGIKKSDILNRYTTEKAYTISVGFTKDTDVYRIETRRGSTQTVKLFKNNQDVSAHTSTATYKLIEETMGMDHKTFAQIIYQSSASSLEFLTATDSNRKKFLIDLLDLSIYPETCEVFKATAKQLETEVTAVNAKIDSANSWLKKNATIDLTPKPVVKVKEAPRNLYDQIGELKAQLSNITNLNKRTIQNNEYAKLMRNIDVIPPGPKPVHEKLQALKGERLSLSGIQQSSKALLSKLGAIASSTTCPTCLQDIDACKRDSIILQSQTSKDVTTARIAEIDRLLAEMQREDNQWAARVAVLEEYERYNALFDPEMSSELLDREAIMTQISALEAEVKRIELEISSAQTANRSAEAHNAKISVITEQIAEFNEELVTLNARLKVLLKELNNTQVLVKAFGPNGIVAYKIECLVKDLEEQTNLYLTELSDGRFQLRFEVSTSDKLNVVITDNGNDIDILALSSGERARVNVATLLGIRKLLQSLSNNRINLLFLDETIENLDVDGKEKLVEVLLQEEHLNTVLISHSFTHPLIEKLNIIKTNNISRIE